MTEERKTTFVTCVLDETGSMHGIKDDTIGGFNNYVKTLRESGEDYLFTLIKFDSNHHDVVHRGVPISEVLDLNNDTYVPGSSTPLIDACVKAIRATEAKVTDAMNVAVMILTDGLENASTEFKNDDLVRLIKEKTEAGWLFTFIGAGIDAFEQAGQFGIHPQHAMSSNRDTVRTTITGAAHNLNAYARTGVPVAAAWTTEQRMKAGGHMPPPTSPPTPVVVETRKSIVDDIEI